MIRPAALIDDRWWPFDARGIPARIANPRVIYRFHRTVLAARHSLQRENEPIPTQLLLLEQFLSLAATRLYTLDLIHRVKTRSEWSARACAGGEPPAPAY